MFDHTPPLAVNSYAEPLLPLAPHAPTRAVLPLIETELPKRLPAVPSEAVSLAVCVSLAQFVPGCVKM